MDVLTKWAREMYTVHNPFLFVRGNSMAVQNEEIVHYQYSITAENLILEILFEKVVSQNNASWIHISDHTHPFAEIFACGKESIEINSPDGILKIQAGEAVVIPPNIPHHCLNLPDKEVWQSISFFLRKQPMLECQDLYGLLEPFGFSDRMLVLHQVPELFPILRELTENYNNTRRMIPGLHFLYQLCRIAEENHFGAMDEHRVEATYDSNYVRLNLLDRIINTEFMQGMTADEVAQKLHISARQLARIVKQRYNKTLYQVIAEKRLNVAAEMLRTSDMPAEKIALTVGFTSKNVFWKEFQMKYGMTPAKYRHEKQDSPEGNL